MATLAKPPYHVERIDGREIEKPLPKRLHWLVQSYLIAQSSGLPSGLEIGGEVNVICGNDLLIPDVVIARRAAHYIDGDLADAPELAVEILSPGQSIGVLFDKVHRLLETGTPTGWIIWPEKQQAWIYTKEGLNEAESELICIFSNGDSWRIRLSDIWAKLD